MICELVLYNEDNYFNLCNNSSLFNVQRKYHFIVLTRRKYRLLIRDNKCVYNYTNSIYNIVNNESSF